MLRMVLLALTILSLAACAGAAPVRPLSLDDLSAFPGSTPLEPGNSPMADAVANALAQTGAGANVTLRSQTLPRGTTWDELQIFYGEALEAEDWQRVPALDSANPALNTAGWQRGSSGSEQVILLGYVVAVADDPPVAVLTLVSEQP
ncbi:MAG: hypothetical protein AB4911_01100 [Oscillochloridaceae bacterium umkhey_bin13]